MCSLFESFSKSLASFPIGPEDTLLVAVSGGPDSVCLLHLLRRWVSDPSAFHGRLPVSNRLHVAHLHHGFRKEADEEADFVAHLCHDWGISSTIAKRPVAEICKEKRLSKQDGARQVRYAFLKEVADAQKARWIILGHTADDCAETVLMHLIRGAGSEGLSGIPRIREETIIRPLLQITRAEILRELQAEKIPYREDSSNTDKRFLRSRIRHDLLPFLSTINPNIKKTLLRVSSLLYEDNHFLNQQVEALATQHVQITPYDVAYDLAWFGSLHKALQRRLLRWGMQHLCGSLNGMDFHHVDAILTDVIPHAKPLALPHRLSAQRQGDRLALRRVQSPETPPPAHFTLPEGFLQQINLTPVTLDIPAWKIQLTFQCQAKKTPLLFPKTSASALLDYEKISFPWVIRSWKPGDTLIPLGMRGRHKKVQDFFVDRKVPQAIRNNVPLLVGPEGIVWIIGYAIDERYRVTETTKTILTLRCCSQNPQI